jgi:hypothetical protein
MAYLKQWPQPIVLTLFSIGLLSISLVAQDPRAARDVDVKVDYAVARDEILKFEIALSRVIASTFSSSPFALVQRPKGAYLPGYGVTFTFLINIHRAVIDTPFGQMRRGDSITPELKKRIVEDLKDKLIRVVLDNGDSLTQLRKEDAITVIAFMEDQNFPDEPNQNKTIILTALKKDFDDVAHKEDKWKEFRQRMKIVEY